MEFLLWILPIACVFYLVGYEAGRAKVNHYLIKWLNVCYGLMKGYQETIDELRGGKDG